MGFKSVGKCAQNCDMKNREKRWLQSRPTDRWYLELIVKRLCCINCLNSCATNCASCGTIFLYQNDETNYSSLQFTA